MIYLRPAPSESLVQGDVFAECPLVLREPDDTLTVHSGTVIVLTQTCDLAQAKTQFAVVGVVKPAEAMVTAGDVKAQTVRDQIRRGLTFGLYFLPEAPAPIQLPESIVDLRDLHTLPRATLEQLVTSGKRLCRLATPYREHLAQHFAVTYMRVALPEPYETRP